MNIREISKLAGVSPAAVSIVINNRKGVSASTREHVKRIMEQYNYHPQKRGSKNKKSSAETNKILFLKHRKHGMLVEENQGFISAIMDSIEAECRKLQFDLNIIISDNQFVETIHSIDFSSYIGMIVLATELDWNLYKTLLDIPIPFVVVDNNVPSIPCSTVSIDNWGNVYRALEFCISLGHTEIAYFRSNLEIQIFKERRSSFYESSRILGLSCSSLHEFSLTPTLLGSYKDLKKTLQKFKPQLPSCAFADNDSIAIGAIKALKEVGYRVPDDISVIGFDDIPYSAITSPPLTTIRVSRQEIGCLSVQQLLRICENRSHLSKTQVPGDLIIRNSVK